MIYGRGQERSFKSERMVVVKEDNTRGEQEWMARNHMTDPERISTVERRELVDRTVGLIRGLLR
jgi:hypothetical protein